MSAATPEDRLPTSSGAKPTPPPLGLPAHTNLRNLELRIVSGIVMIAVAMGLLYAGTLWFSCLVLVVSMPMAWEWGHLVRATTADRAFWLHAATVGVGVLLAASGNPLPALGILGFGAVTILAMTPNEVSKLSALGVIYVGLPAVVLLWLRDDTHLGFEAVVFLFLVVWSTDIMAFISGRTLGGPKLWAAISPNKTWAGFLGGVSASLVLSALFAFAVPEASALRLAVLGACLSVIAQGGDLAESALKRDFGVKDASGLIPGHGGFMDRMDGFVTVAVAAAMFAALVDASAPATALLLGL